MSDLLFSAEEQINELEDSSRSHSTGGRKKDTLNWTNVNREDMFWKLCPFKEI